jgi:hypothetical protein
MSSYKVTETDHYEIGITNAGECGYFEHKMLGDDKAGGLWFKDGALVDYDGVYYLPNEVAKELNKRGVNTSYLDDN